MDSGNSGSMSLQSSSGGGGEDEFDSRCGGGDEDSSPLSALLRQQPAAPSSSATHLPGFGGSSSFFGIHDLATLPMSETHRTSSSATAPLTAYGAGASSTAPQPTSSHGVPAPVSADHHHAVAAPAAATRASRKRTRASRRAPTTVLTTDTSNFRAMVQEFTGVPAPPFAPGAGARSSRFDHLFSSRQGPAATSPYIIRPFAHKLQAQPQAPSMYPSQPFIATSSPANNAIAPSTAPRNTMPVASSSVGFQLASVGPPISVLGMQDHRSSGSYLSFQSPAGTHMDGNASRYPQAHSMFDAAGSSPARQRLPDPAGFKGLARGGGDELSGLVGAASSHSRAVPPGRERDAQGTAPVAATAGMRAQAAGVESSWICTSDQ